MTGWQERALLEADAILDEALPVHFIDSTELLRSLVAVGWLQGVTYGTHIALDDVDAAFERLRADMAKQ